MFSDHLDIPRPGWPVRMLKRLVGQLLLIMVYVRINYRLISMLKNNLI